MNIAQEMLKRIGEGTINPAVLEQIANMDEDKLARLLEKETFKQESDNLGLSDFAATIEEIYQLEGLDGLFSKIKRGFKKIAHKIKREAKRVCKKVKKELKRPGVWKAVGAVANFIPGVGPIMGTAITAAARTIGTMREARMAEKEYAKQEAEYARQEAAYAAAQPPAQIVYDSPTPQQIRQTVAGVTQIATPYTVQAMKAQGLQPTPQQQSPKMDMAKVLPIAAIPLAMLMFR